MIIASKITLHTVYSVHAEYESNPSRIFLAGFSAQCKPNTVRKINIQEYLLANAAHAVTFATAYPTSNFYRMHCVRQQFAITCTMYVNQVLQNEKNATEHRANASNELSIFNCMPCVR